MTILGAEVPVVGVAGTGPSARAHIRAWRALGVPVRLTASRDAEPHPSWYDDEAAPVTTWSELLERCDVIDLCTPAVTRAPLAAEAIAAGRHVICEQPLALDAATAGGLEAAAADAGVLLLPAHVMRFVPASEALHAAVETGRLGSIVFARFTRASPAPATGVGGVIFDHAIHDIDQALRVAGPVARVSARRVTWPDAPTESAMLALSHAGGAICHVVAVWGAPQTPFRTTYRVTGTQGTVSHDSVTASGLRLRGSADDVPGDPGLDTRAASPLLAELAEFLRAVTLGDSARVGASDGVAAVVVADAALRSAETGRAVPIAGPGDPESASVAS
jgi:myo-inositol 2-dehydrogenase/D-chiro-inositol 1-dehydrogenase